MQTNLADFIRNTAQGREAEAILRNCVHCGFCNATCPTYQLLGDELDGPRGRIYLMKQMLEGQPVTAVTREHLDRCLTCRNCETTCPSGVQYGRLIDIGREVVEKLSPRPLAERLLRMGLRRTLASPRLFGSLLKLGQGVSWALPATLREHLPPLSKGGGEGFVDADRSGTVTEIPPAPLWERGAKSTRRMLVLEGCVQPALAPETNLVAARVLASLGIQLFAAPEAGCCGALDQHLAAPEAAKAAMRRNIDAWWLHLEAGAEAIVMTASGCGSTVKEYGHHLRDDPAYAEKAARVSELTLDLAEVLAREDLSHLRRGAPRRVAFHPPCSLQHGQKVRGVIEAILSSLGHELVPVAESHLCCGAAGTYSLLQPELSGQLRERKLSHLQAARPDLIATANIGCQSLLAAAGDVPVVHWITLLN
ncbi:MAG: glycolate oxidase subunit GlcF [Pseudomonadota bacterium]|nr:glycolate oxidase subunit GlcF [Pseudomonadota bacterium]MDP1906382.1 glycolate oxidase subunit GlcF [Pseudomonadota bacterium]MDP2351483.1 glycolate oxidase subunit GlcF [Pseudomonadota bacterium]